jgi:hypothetical protein
MRAPLKTPRMPLPKSILCSQCRKTYPEGWKRCPYCGHDEMRNKQEAQSRRFLQRKIQEFEQRTGKIRREDRRTAPSQRPPRPERDRQQRPQPPQERREGQPGSRRRRRRGRGRRGDVPRPDARGAPVSSPAGAAPAASPPPAKTDAGGSQDKKRRRFRRRRRGGRGGGKDGGGQNPPKPPTT